MSNIILVKNNIADAVIPAYTLVKYGTADGHIIPAAAVLDSILGISTDIPAAIGDRCDVIVEGVADVIYGGTVTRGDLLTTNATGQAVTAAPAAAANNRIVGVAVVSGVLNDIGQVKISQGMMQG